MADAYGGLVTCMSEDCVIDGNALADAMKGRRVKVSTSDSKIGEAA